MALSKSYQQMLASQSNAAGGTINSASLTINYGATFIAKVTNGPTGPSPGCDVVLQVSDDGSTWFEADRRTAGTVAGSSYSIAFFLGVAGGGGDWKLARLQFTSNLGQAVTVQADAESTVTL